MTCYTVSLCLYYFYWLPWSCHVIVDLWYRPFCVCVQIHFGKSFISTLAPIIKSHVTIPFILWTLLKWGWGSMMSTQMVLRLPHRHMICGTFPSHSYTKVCHLQCTAERTQTHVLTAGPCACLIYTTAWTVRLKAVVRGRLSAYWLLGHQVSNNVWNQSKDI